MTQTATTINNETMNQTATTNNETMNHITMSRAKTMQDLENQGYRLIESNWRRRNTWESSAAEKRAKNNRDKLIDRAYLNAAAYHLTNKAKEINEYLEVIPFGTMDLRLDYNSPAVGMTIKILPPFALEALLNTPAKVLELLFN